MHNAPTRIQLHVEGVVQGVGFRPYVYRLATAHQLVGWVQNNVSGVTIEVEGEQRNIDSFVRQLPLDAPPLARLVSVKCMNLKGSMLRLSEDKFFILPSDGSSREVGSSVLVPPDIATCDECLQELFDESNHRYRYPFTNCTNCGPRFTIINGVPYDRKLTTMSAFKMCARCQAEYDNPLDRRFHAQPNACKECGPSATLLNSVGIDECLHDRNADPLKQAALRILEGAIVAVKGIGGFHLACLAIDDTAVMRLRKRKRRAHKPFALMVADIHAAGELIELEECVERLLVSPECPIVLARTLASTGLSPGVTPGLGELGVMLPYSPIHHLLLRDVGAPLVMTSGNLSGQPISHTNEAALERLSGIADFFLVHDRPIATPTDDSIVRVVNIGGRSQSMMIRRSRGYAPSSHMLPFAASRAMVCCGAELKSTYCVVQGARAWIGPHVGDLEQYEALESFRHGISHHERLFDITPEMIVHDLHPEYLSTKYAISRADVDDITTTAVQHHHAHHAACMAEHGLQDSTMGVIFDGTGLGSDGTLWGGEIIVGDLCSFERVAHLWPVRMPGGVAAIRAPWRMACAWLSELQIQMAGDADSDGIPPLPKLLASTVSDRDWMISSRLSRSGFASPITSSVGRLLDALAALCGICATITYEGQAAIEFEAVADPTVMSHYDCPIIRHPEGRILDARAIVKGVMDDLAHGTTVSEISARVHNSLVQCCATCCAEIASKRDITTVLLSGGVFQNSLLLGRMILALESRGLDVRIPIEIPPNDGGIAFGQASVAAARSAMENRLV